MPWSDAATAELALAITQHVHVRGTCGRGYAGTVDWTELYRAVRAGAHPKLKDRVPAASAASATSNNKRHLSKRAKRVGFLDEALAPSAKARTVAALVKHFGAERAAAMVNGADDDKQE